MSAAFLGVAGAAAPKAKAATAYIPGTYTATGMGTVTMTATFSETAITAIIIQRNEDSAYIQLNAAKGVVLSTGGYGGNPEMLEALHYRDKNVICNNLGCGFAMGDGIKMAMWAGVLTNMHSACFWNIFRRKGVCLRAR